MDRRETDDEKRARELEEMHAAYEEMDMNELAEFMAEMDARDAERDRG